MANAKSTWFDIHAEKRTDKQTRGRCQKNHVRNTWMQHALVEHDGDFFSASASDDSAGECDEVKIIASFKRPRLFRPSPSPESPARTRQRPLGVPCTLSPRHLDEHDGDNVGPSKNSFDTSIYALRMHHPTVCLLWGVLHALGPKMPTLGQLVSLAHGAQTSAFAIDRAHGPCWVQGYRGPRRQEVELTFHLGLVDGVRAALSRPGSCVTLETASGATFGNEHHHSFSRLSPRAWRAAAACCALLPVQAHHLFLLWLCGQNPVDCFAAWWMSCPALPAPYCLSDSSVGRTETGYHRGADNMSMMLSGASDASVPGVDCLRLQVRLPSGWLVSWTVNYYFWRRPRSCMAV